MHVTSLRTGTIIEYLGTKFDISICSAYGEPGYNDPESGIIFADWNRVSRRIGDYLEEAGFELEWEDEWYVADNGKAYRTSPNCYDWEPSLCFTDDGDTLTPDDPLEEWIDLVKVDDHHHSIGFRCLPSWITEDELFDFGLLKFPDEDSPDFESGWHPGQTDDPQKIAKEVFAIRDDIEYLVFRIAEKSQFYIKWQVFYMVGN